MASRVDWNEVILGLRRMGFGITSIAAAIGVSKSNLCAWGRGVEPTFSRGEALVDFWCQVTKQSREDLPQLTSIPPAASRRHAIQIVNILNKQ
ncbi:hypothetical protein CBR71_03755 [Bordetella hinzii]|nr:hypothetical protein CBR71_03755 [Bordetella hinzii]